SLDLSSSVSFLRSHHFRCHRIIFVVFGATFISISVISSLSVSSLKVDPLLPVVGVEVIFAVDITGVIFHFSCVELLVFSANAVNMNNIYGSPWDNFSISVTSPWDNF
ncbi:14231_t:CDS:1, partial [Gigaspora rosea]